MEGQGGGEEEIKVIILCNGGVGYIMNLILPMRKKKGVRKWRKIMVSSS